MDSFSSLILPWLPTALLALFLYISRQALETRLKESIKHEFDQKQEAFKTENTKAVEALKVALQAELGDLAAVRSVALANLTSRQSTLDKRRLDAVEQVWKSVLQMSAARQVAVLASVMDYKETLAAMKTSAFVRAMVKDIGKDFQMSSLAHPDASAARPFVSPLVWANFMAYRGVCTAGVMRWQCLDEGVDNPQPFSPRLLRELLAEALPGRDAVIEASLNGSLVEVLELLESSLLSGFGAMLSGDQDDESTVRRAGQILQKAKAFQGSVRGRTDGES